MINDFLANHGGTAGAIVYLLTLILEAVIGKTQPLGAASILALIPKIIDYLRSRSTKGANAMTSSNPNVKTIQVVVDGPTYDALGVVVSLVKDIAAGKKPQEALAAALPAIMGSFGQLGQIPTDLSLDKTSVVEAVSQRVGDLIEAFVLAKSAAPAPATKPAA